MSYTSWLLVEIEQKDDDLQWHTACTPFFRAYCQELAWTTVARATLPKPLHG